MPGNAANSPRCAGDHHGVSCFGCADIQQCEVGGHAGHAQCGQIHRQRYQFRVDLVETPWFACEVILHAQGTVDVVPYSKARVCRSDDLAHTEGAHHIAQRNRRDIGLALVHPATHGRVKGQVFVLDQDLPLLGLYHGHSLEGEGVAGCCTDWTFGEQELAVCLVSHCYNSLEIDHC